MHGLTMCKIHHCPVAKLDDWWRQQAWIKIDSNHIILSASENWSTCRSSGFYAPSLCISQQRGFKPGWRNGNLKSWGKKWANLGSLFNLLKEQLHLRFLLPSANDDKTVKEKDKYALEMEHSCCKGCAWKACINNSNMFMVHSADHYYVQHLTALSLLLLPGNTQQSKALCCEYLLHLRLRKWWH